MQALRPPKNNLGCEYLIFDGNHSNGQSEDPDTHLCIKYATGDICPYPSRFCNFKKEVNQFIYEFSEFSRGGKVE
jgi:hypothetical protein